MASITGIGGVYFKTGDNAALAAYVPLPISSAGNKGA